MKPIVSILALCYHHAPFLEEALQSLEKVDGPGVEILVADDASSDSSVEILKAWQLKKPNWTFVFHQENVGNCKTFNELLQLANGDMVLDFATDDRLMQDHFLEWVRFLENHPGAGFCYADAQIVDEAGSFLHLHSAKVHPPYFPEGQILSSLFQPHFICPPAVLFRKSALEKLGGYNENLDYEDWDIWLRLARLYPVCHFPKPVIEYRKHPQSLSASIFEKRNEKHLLSTLEILKQVNHWPEVQKDNNWKKFVCYQLEISGWLQFKASADGFFHLLKQEGKTGWKENFFRMLAHVPLPIFHLTRWVRKWRT